MPKKKFSPKCEFISINVFQKLNDWKTGIARKPLTGLSSEEEAGEQGPAACCDAEGEAARSPSPQLPAPGRLGVGALRHGGADR